MKTKEEIEKVILDGAYWQEFGDRFGWRLQGWTFRYTATFITGTYANDVLEITGGQRDRIMEQTR